MLMLEKCRESANDSSFKKKEEGKTFELKSEIPISCDIFGVETCLFKNASFKRCDWLFVVPKNNDRNSKLKIEKQRAYYVELKGENLRDVCEQLYNAIDKTKTSFPNFEFHARIVSSKGIQPEIRTSEFYKKVKRLIHGEVIVGKAHRGNQNTYTEII